MDRLLRQKPKDKGKLYALHEPEVDCISKGKARVRYEFGTKVSVATTHKEGFVVGMRSMPGNPYDGHTLREALELALGRSITPAIGLISDIQATLNRHYADSDGGVVTAEQDRQLGHCQCSVFASKPQCPH